MTFAARVLAVLAVLPALARAQGTTEQENTLQPYTAVVTVRGMT